MRTKQDFFTDKCQQEPCHLKYSKGWKFEDRVSVLLCCNMNGTDKKIPIFIKPSKNPRPFKNIDVGKYIDYKWNKKADGMPFSIHTC